MISGRTRSGLQFEGTHYIIVGWGRGMVTKAMWAEELIMAHVLLGNRLYNFNALLLKAS